MRGNEVPTREAAEPETVQKFPIPMRGNEKSSRATTSPVLAFGGFPIPMRGNETSGRWRPVAPPTVSDPHEG